MSKEEDLEELEVIERYIILLLGVKEGPIPSETHLQKELFLLSMAHPIMQKFITFEKHYYGPYSEVVSETSRCPVFFSAPFEYDEDGKLFLLEEGKKKYCELIEENGNEARFKKLLSAMKLIRQIYDKLTTDELLFLIYITYKEYTEKSNIAKKLLSAKNRVKLSQQLLQKKVITEGRYEELVQN